MYQNSSLRPKGCASQCLLLGVNQTFQCHASMSAYDPKRTLMAIEAATALPPQTIEHELVLELPQKWREDESEAKPKKIAKAEQRK